MKKLSFTLFLLLSIFMLNAQVKVRFVLTENTFIPHDSIYITGSFSNWDSTTNEQFRMKSAGGNRKEITLTLPRGEFRYKFHRGSWHRVEKGFNGEEIPDRVVELRNDTTLYSQINAYRDELFLDKWAALSGSPADTTRVIMMTSLATNYAFFQEFYNNDSALYYAQEALKIQQKISGFQPGDLSQGGPYPQQIYGLQEILASLLHSMGNYPKALELRLSNLSFAEQETDPYFRVQALRGAVTDYMSMKDWENALTFQRKGDSILANIPHRSENHNFETYLSASNLGLIYYNLNRFDSALIYIRKAEKLVSTTTFLSRVFSHQMLGDLFRSQNQTDSAFHYYAMVIHEAGALDSKLLFANGLMGTAKVFNSLGRQDSALVYSKAAVELLMNNPLNVRSWGENSGS
ncbi:MAG TPA: tetratricopeptide repeat protein, partial [Flavitalea sp.]|nr:tetratricopeptide repeat protein [Flavitalea sp.]